MADNLKGSSSEPLNTTINDPDGQMLKKYGITILYSRKTDEICEYADATYGSNKWTQEIQDEYK